MQLVVSHSWRDKSDADRLARDLESVADVVLDIRGLRDGKPDAGMLLTTDAVVVVWSPNAASSDGVRHEIDAARGARIPVIPCFIDDNGPPPPTGPGVADAIDLRDPSTGFARLLVTLLRGRLEEPGLTPPLRAGADLATVIEHVRDHRDIYAAADGGEFIDKALEALAARERQDDDLHAQLEDGMAAAQAGIAALDRQPLGRVELESVLVELASRESEYPGLLSPLISRIHRALATLPEVDPSGIELPTLTIDASSDRQLRLALAAVVDASMVDDALAAVTHYINEAPPTIEALFRLAEARSSPAIARAAQSVAAYFADPNDLLPDHFGLIGRLDDCWLVHNLVFRVVEAGLASSGDLPGDWVQVLSADALVVAMLSDDVLHGLEELLLDLLDDLANEADHYEPEFVADKTGRYEPIINPDPRWRARAATTPAATYESTKDEDDSWSSPEVGLFLGMAGVAISMWYSLEPSFSRFPRVAICLVILIIPIPLISVGAGGLVRFIRVLAEPARWSDTLRRDRQKQVAQHRRWRPRLLAEMAAIIAVVGLFVFWVGPRLALAPGEVEIPRSKDLAEQADEDLSTNTRLGLWGALEAYRVWPTYEATDVLLQGIQQSIHAVDEREGAETRVVVVSPGGTVMATGRGDGTIQFWDLGADGQVERGEEIESLSGYAVTAIHFIDESTVLWGDAIGRVRLDRASGDLDFLVGHDGEVVAIASTGSGDDLRIISAGSDNQVLSWVQSATGWSPTRVGGEFRQLLALDLSSDSRFLAISDGSDVFVYNAAELSPSSEPIIDRLDHRQRVAALAFDPVHTARLISADDAGGIGILNVETDTRVPLFDSDSPITSLAFAGGADLVLSGNSDGEVKVWDVTAGGPNPIFALGPGGAVADVALSHEGSMAMVARGDGLWLYSLGSDQPLAGVAQPNLIGGPTGTVTVISDRDLIVSGGNGGATMWGIIDGEIIGPGQPIGPSGAVRVVVSDGGGRLAAAGDDVIRVWPDVADTELSFEIAVGDGVKALAFAGDGVDVVWVDVEGAVQRSVDSVVATIGVPALTGSNVTAADISPNGKRAATGHADGTIVVWDVEDTTASASLLDTTHVGWIDAVALSRDGDTLVSARADGTIAVSDLRGERLSWPVPFLQGLDVSSLEVSNDGSMLAVGLGERLRLFDLEERKWLGPTLSGATGEILGTTFGADDDVLAVASADFSANNNAGFVQLWSTNPLDWVDLACDVVERNPDVNQWDYVSKGWEPDYIRLCPAFAVGEGAVQHASDADYN